MDKIVVEGGVRLAGTVRVSGAKNATLDPEDHEFALEVATCHRWFALSRTAIPVSP